MGNLAWLPSYSVGVEILDEQHKGIIEMINLLISESADSVDSETISELLTRLTRYASEHFETEIKLLEKHGYPDLENHKEEHREYRLTVVNLCRNTMNHLKSVPDDLAQFLQKWWVDHIMESDMEYKEFFAQRGVR